MINNILTIISFTFSIICCAQTTTYYKDEYLQKEISLEKANFSRTITQNEDKSITTVITNLKKNEVIHSETYKDNEPFGVWKYQRSNGISELDYSFELNYSEITCNDSISGIKNYFENNDSLKYIAPVISSGESSIFQFIAKNIVYPQIPKENGISGTVYLTFTITKEGLTDNIKIKRGANIQLDKEAVRVLRKLKFSNPPKLNGQYKSVCFTMPIKYTLR